MTLETCKAQLEKWKRIGNEEKVKFWEERIRRKAAKHQKYKNINVDEFLGIKGAKTDGKKPKG